MKTEYQVVSGKRKMLLHSAGHATQHDAIDSMVKMQLDHGRRGLRVVKLVPYGANHRRVIELKKKGTQ